MKKYKNHISIFIILLLIACVGSKILPAQAESASVWFELVNEPAIAGQEVQIRICIKTDAELGNFEGTLSYNDDILEFISGPSCVTGGSGTLKISDMNASSSWDTRNYILIFKALKRGTSLIQMLNTPVAYEYSADQPMSVSSTAFMLDVEPSEESSDNAKLSIMKINPGTLTPSFSPDIFEYSTIVDAETNRLIVSAIPEDLKSTVSVEGHNNLKTGDNKVTILVTAPSGAELSYIIRVVKEEAESAIPTEPLSPTEEPKEEKGSTWRFEVKEIENEILMQGQYSYKVLEPTKDTKTPKGYTKTKMSIQRVSMTVYAKTNDESGEFFILLLENEAGEVGFYRYDRVEKTVQRYTENEGEKTVATTIQEQELLQDAIDLVKYQKNAGELTLIVAISCGVSVLLLIAVVSLGLKLRKYKNEFE